MQKRRGVCLLLPSMNFLGSSARSANTRVFCQYLCKYSKNTDKGQPKRIFLLDESIPSGFLRGCCWSKYMENSRLPELSFVVFFGDSVIGIAEYAPKSDSICGMSLPREVSRGEKRVFDPQSYIIGWNSPFVTVRCESLPDRSIPAQEPTCSTPHGDATTDS